ncbi:MAG TPA: hypothetical protein VIM16_06570 [Mucilaginibacter sp.]|jgi:hypothetical protein
MENSVKEKKAKGRNKGLSKRKQPIIQNKPDNTRVSTVTPANDNCKPDPSLEDSSNVGQGPAIENL